MSPQFFARGSIIGAEIDCIANEQRIIWVATGEATLISATNHVEWFEAL